MRIVYLTLTFLLCLNSASALKVLTNGIRNKGVYGITFPGSVRAFYGKADGVQSISKQEYVTATFRVIEVNIVTQSSALLRIYYSRPLRIEEIKKKAAETAGATGTPAGSIIRSPLPPHLQKRVQESIDDTADALTDTTVIKEYPLATHSHTIEYRIGSRAELLRLYDELQKHWTKEPALYADGQIVTEEGEIATQRKPRNLGGTLFVVEN